MKDLDVLACDCICELCKLSQSVSAFIAANVDNADALSDLLGWFRLVNWDSLRRLRDAD